MITCPARQLHHHSCVAGSGQPLRPELSKPDKSGYAGPIRRRGFPMRFTLAAAVLAAAIASFAHAPAAAQATRTWVSGVGDDVNPCSRTAPCKTFAGAISKTAAGREISVLDPGGFGAVSITKSIS